jgi:hypothetical protein
LNAYTSTLFGGALMIRRFLVALLLTGCGVALNPAQLTSSRLVDRKLGFGVTEGSIGYERSFADALDAGLEFLELPQQWDEVEKQPGQFESPFVNMANTVYPPHNVSIVLSMNPIDTTALRVPSYLSEADWESSERIEAFCRWFDWTMAQLPDTSVFAMSIGNEVDGWLAQHPEQTEGYAKFFTEVRKHIRKTHPEMIVGCKTTFSGRSGLSDRLLNQMDQSADAIMLTYYPLDSGFKTRPPDEVASDFDVMIQFASGKPVYILEAGYPSGVDCDSSPERQAAFIDALFEAWDARLENIPLINFIWTCDLSDSEVDSMVQYYGVGEPAFRAYLATLGLRHNDGINKPAFERLRDHVQSRSRVLQTKNFMQMHE